MKKLLYGLWLIVIAPQLSAQEKANKTFSNAWSVSIHAGPSLGGLSKRQLNNLMVGAGLGETEYNWLFGITRYPKATKPGTGQVVLTYRFRNTWAMSAGLSTWGDYAEGYAQGRRVDFSYAGTSLLLLCSQVTADNVFRIGVGPLLNSIATGVSGSPTKRAFRVGGILDTGVRFPARSRLFADFALQYQYAGLVTYGPYPLGSSRAGRTYFFPKTNIPLNYLNLTLGFGLRL